MLCTELNHLGVKKALWEIRDDKALGIDGYMQLSKKSSGCHWHRHL